MPRPLYIPLANRVRGPYCKLRTDFFPHRFIAQTRSALAINRRGKTRIHNLQYDRENEVSTIFSVRYLYCVPEGFGFDFYSHGMVSNFRRTSEAKRVNLKLSLRFNPLTPVPPVTNLGLSSSSDVIAFDQNWHHLYSTSAGGRDLSNDAQIRVIGPMEP